MEVVVTTGYWSYKSCKAPVKSSPPTNQHPVFYRPDALPVAQPTVSKHWRENYHIPWTCSPQPHLGFFQLCLWPPVAPGNLGEGCHASHQSSDASTPTTSSGIDFLNVLRSWFGTSRRWEFQPLKHLPFVVITRRIGWGSHISCITTSFHYFQQVGFSSALAS